MDTTLRWFVRLWIALFLLVNLIALIGFFLGTASSWEAVLRASEFYSPSNLGNWVIEFLLLSPAVGAHFWLTQRKHRKEATQEAARDYSLRLSQLSKSLSVEPREVIKATHLLDSDPEIGELFEVYGSFIAGCDISTIRDVKELPLPKEHIEATLLRAISLFDEYPQYQAHCEAVLLSLAFFQDGVGEPLLSPVEAVNRKYEGVVLKDLPKEQMCSIVDELAEAVATKARSQRWEWFEPKVQADLMRLRQLVSTAKRIDDESRPL